MERRSFITIAAALPGLALLAPATAKAKTTINLIPQDIDGVREEVLRMRILHAEEKARVKGGPFFSPRNPNAAVQLVKRSHTEEGRADVNNAFERINQMRLDWFKHNPQDESFVPTSIKDLVAFFQYRRYQRFHNNPISNLRTTPEAIEDLKARGMLSHSEYLCSPNTWALTIHLAKRLGWDSISEAILS